MAAPSSVKGWAQMLASVAAVLAPSAAIMTHLGGLWRLPRFVMQTHLDDHTRQMRAELTAAIDASQAAIIERQRIAAAREQIMKQIANAERALEELPDGPARSGMIETRRELYAQLDRLNASDN